MAALQECFVALRIANFDAHGFVPAIGYITKLRLEYWPQFRDHTGKRIGKIFVLATPESMAPHHHPAAEPTVVRIERRKRAALILREQSLQHRAALRIEIAACLRPVDGIDPRGDNRGRCRTGDILCG